jgi:Tol biopolymer transport system component
MRVLPREERVDSPIWSPDSRRLAFWSETERGIYTIAVDGSDRSARLVTVDGGRLYPNAWSPDGRSIAFIQERPQLTVRAVETAAPHVVRPMAPGRGAEVELSYSPDGRFVAHTGFTGEVPEIVVGPADNPQRRWPVADRGRHPTWSADGRELLFMEAAAIHAVPIDRVTGQATGRPRKVVDLPARASVDAVAPSRDGKRFLVRERVDDTPPRIDVLVVLNWLEELRGKIP